MFLEVNMSETQKRATIYLDSFVHKALKLKSIETNQSVSSLVNHALLQMLQEDEEDLRVFQERAGESVISFEQMLTELKKNGKI